MSTQPIVTSAGEAGACQDTVGVVLAGVGGQGILLASEIMGEAFWTQLTPQEMRDEVYGLVDGIDPALGERLKEVDKSNEGIEEPLTANRPPRTDIDLWDFRTVSDLLKSWAASTKPLRPI